MNVVVLPNLKSRNPSLKFELMWVRKIILLLNLLHVTTLGFGSNCSTGSFLQADTFFPELKNVFLWSVCVDSNSCLSCGCDAELIFWEFPKQNSSVTFLQLWFHPNSSDKSHFRSLICLVWTVLLWCSAEEQKKNPNPAAKLLILSNTQASCDVLWKMFLTTQVSQILLMLQTWDIILKRHCSAALFEPFILHLNTVDNMQLLFPCMRASKCWLANPFHT